jgi:transposase-like protein
MFPISYRDLELMLLDRGVEVDHTTIFRWIQAYAAELEKRMSLSTERDVLSALSDHGI